MADRYRRRRPSSARRCTSSAAATLRRRRPCTSRATRDGSRWSFGHGHSTPACRITSSAPSRPRRTSTRAPGQPSPAAAVTVVSDGLFVLIGARPMTEWLPPELARDSHGFLLTGEDVGDAWSLERRPLSLETSLQHVLAAGDVRHGLVKRVAAAVGEGAIAVQLVHRMLAEDTFAVTRAS